MSECTDEYKNYLTNLGFDTTDIDKPIVKKLPNTIKNNINNEIIDNIIITNDKIFDDEFICPVCLDIITKTLTVMECLHRFCFDCLHKCLRMELGSNKHSHECPKCRCKIPSRRSSKSDPLYDILIDKFSSKTNNNNDRYDWKHYNTLHQLKVSEFKKLSKELVVSNNKRKYLSYEDNLSNASNKSSMPNFNKLIAYSLLPYYTQGIDLSNANKKISHLKRPYIQTEDMITIKDIKSYLIQSVDPWSLITFPVLRDYVKIYMQINSKMIELNDDETMRSICIDRWDGNSKLQLYYTLSDIKHNDNIIDDKVNKDNYDSTEIN